MEVTVDQVADMSGMGNGWVPALRTVDVSGFMPLAVVIRGAGVGMCRIRCDFVLVHVILMARMEVSVVQIVDVVFMLDGNVSTASSVNVVVTFMSGMRQGVSPLL